MKNRILSMVAAMLLALGLSLAAVSPASATETGPPAPPTCVTYNNGTTVCSAAAASDSSTNIVVRDAASSHSKTVTDVYYVQSGGATKAQMHGKHYRLKHSKRMQTSWRVNRGYGWHMKWYPKGYLFVKGKDGYWHDPKCWNSVVGIPHGKRHVGHVIHTKIVVHQYFKATATAKATAQGTGWASASCQVSGASAYSQSQYTLYAYGYASATAKGSTWYHAVVNARKAVAKKTAHARSTAQSNAKASAMAKATGSATANAHCSSSTQTPPQPTPPTCQNVYGPGYTGDYPNCTKDGTTTPPPPPNAPGPNPPPSGGTGDPGSNKCYDETTGQPVPPNQDGTCPPGSFGA